ncbi:MAG: carbohydrate ABC transporter permease, partial [Propionicimonas sp.]|nr:carbohydrate ABC transporter permease [Propionicimonas sp.]
MGQLVRKSVLIVLGAIWLVPVYLMIVNAGKTNADYGKTSPWQPTSLGSLVDNAATAWDRGNLLDGVISTLIYAVVSPSIAAIIGAMAG